MFLPDFMRKLFGGKNRQIDDDRKTQPIQGETLEGGDEMKVKGKI